jgi:hypothetical protein
VISRATLDGGTWSQIEATIRLGTDSRGRPFRIVRWESDPAQSGNSDSSS